MWFYSTYFLHCYLLLFDGIPFATTTLAHPNPKDAPKSHISVDPKDLWNELREVTEGSIDTATRDKAPKHLFQPTSFLNPGYGVLFEHVGQLHQSVYKHFLVIALKILTLHHMPHNPQEWYTGCQQGFKDMKYPQFTKLTLGAIFFEDFCAIDRFKRLYTEITQILHSDIPALLPNQVVPYADISFFNETPAEMPTNTYYLNGTPKRTKRSTVPETDQVLPLLEVQRALDYLSKYNKPIALDEDTIYAPETLVTNSHIKWNTTHHRSKRFLSALIRGIGRIFKGGNIFGKIVSGIKKVGGFIFKGIKGLFYRRKNTALLQAVKTFTSSSRRFLAGKLYKLRKFRGLHLGKSSLLHTICRTWHKSRFWLRNRFSKTFHNLHDNFDYLFFKFRSVQMARSHMLYNLMNYTNNVIGCTCSFLWALESPV